MPTQLFRKGLGLKNVVAEELAQDYHSQLVEQIRSNDYTHRTGRLTVQLAREFGFCYGVDRAVDYAYQTKRKFPNKVVYLTGEIIHNPHVNRQLRSAGIRFLSDTNENLTNVTEDDVVILPAFGVTIASLEQLTHCGCTLVDTTCGSVLNVWKNVRQYARDGYTAVIHGKVKHEETQATASQASTTFQGRYLIILDRDEAAELCRYITGDISEAEFRSRFEHACSEQFKPSRDLQCVGLANQTTMLMSESLAIGQMIRDAMVDRYGEDRIDEHYRAFDTICSATQDRQDAVEDLLNSYKLDLSIVIGGYNSSNTRNLARMCSKQVPTYHIAEPDCLISDSSVVHLPVSETTGQPSETTEPWLPTEGPITIGITAGASTPDNIVGRVVNRLAQITGNETQ